MSHDELVDLGGVEMVEALKGEVVEDEQVNPDGFAHLRVVAVVEPGGPEFLVQHVGTGEDHAVAAARTTAGPRAVAVKV